MGLPRCIDVVSNKYVVIGTSSSLLCLFAMDQKEVKILGGSQEQNYGAIISLDVTADSLHLASAHELGQIVLWDILKAK